MTPKEREALIATALADPNTLWAIMTSKAKVAGPWCTACSETRKVSVHGGVWRLDANEKDVAVVYPSQKPQEPNYWEFVDYYNDDSEDDGEPQYTRDEQYEGAMAEYAAEMAGWKPWTYRVVSHMTYMRWGPHKTRHAYADTMEEAMLFADADLQGVHFLLVEGSNPPIPA